MKQRPEKIGVPTIIYRKLKRREELIKHLKFHIDNMDMHLGHIKKTIKLMTEAKL